MITVVLHTILQRHTPQGVVRRLDVQLPAGSTLGDLIQLLEIEFSLDALLLVVNRRVEDIDYILQPGDQVNLMPAISGG